MDIVKNSTIRASNLGAFDELQIYNAIDSAITIEIFQKLTQTNSNQIYALELALQAPILEMMLRGVLVDQEARAAAREAEAANNLETLESSFMSGRTLFTE